MKRPARKSRVRRPRRGCSKGRHEYYESDRLPLIYCKHCGDSKQLGPRAQAGFKG